MIVTDLQNCDKYCSVNPYFKQLFDYVKTHDILAAELGRITIDGDNLFINNVLHDGKESAPIEAHRQYIDVHILLEGEETYGIKTTSECTECEMEYDAGKDCVLFTDRPKSFVKIYPGQMIILFPEDGHAPDLSDGKIRKGIAKVILK